MKINIQPTPDTIDYWINAFVPEKDLFFLPAKEFEHFKEYIDTALVIPRQEFFNHATYKQIQLNNSYQYWNISVEVDYILVVTPDWVKSLTPDKKEFLFHIQKEVGRGLIYPISYSALDSSIPKEHIIEVDGEHFIILQKAMWKEIPYDIRKNLMVEFAQQWEKWDSCHYPLEAPTFLKKIANTFPTSSGGNCLSATLFAVSQQEWIINEWVHPETFKQGLKSRNYTQTLIQGIQKGDVVIWENSDGEIQHASFCIGNDLFFNKNGQTFFNPWKVVGFAELTEIWGDYNMKIFREPV
ncbi:hypothetical protein [Rossellomorea sp. NS-SX7]|uniref:hypothetical protein n=1 Tax=Rossellomorea sp. NS-SX7 TaxID=3463856 RepID=UPI0040580C81